MKTKFKAGDNIQCYDPIITFKGTIRGTGTILWGSCDSIKTPKEIYLIEGTQDNETIVEWFEVLISTLDNMESSEIEIISDAMSGFISSKNKKQ
tara:strand:+ start:4545 stop:4826 length:282 start_codon:yes stop_codon:yes gene_type:complete